MPIEVCFEDDSFALSFCKNPFKLSIHEFGSTEVKIVSENINSLKDKEILFVYSPFIEKEPCRDFKLLLALNYIKQYSNSISLFSSFLSNSRQDKPTPGKEESISLKYWLYLLKNSGVNRITTVDIHSDKAQYFSSNLGISFNSIPHSSVFFEALKKEEFDVIIAPDKGAKHRAMNLSIILNKPYVILEKKRDYEKGGIEKIIYKGESLEGKKALIVDDIISSGGTIVKVLETLNLKKAILAITHQTLNKRGYENLDYLYKEEYLEKLFISNSIPLKEKRSFIEVVNLSNLRNFVLRL